MHRALRLGTRSNNNGRNRSARLIINQDWGLRSAKTEYAENFGVKAVIPQMVCVTMEGALGSRRPVER